MQMKNVSRRFLGVVDYREDAPGGIARVDGIVVQVFIARRVRRVDVLIYRPGNAEEANAIVFHHSQAAPRGAGRLR